MNYQNSDNSNYYGTCHTNNQNDNYSPNQYSKSPFSPNEYSESPFSPNYSNRNNTQETYNVSHRQLDKSEPRLRGTSHYRSESPYRSPNRSPSPDNISYRNTYHLGKQVVKPVKRGCNDIIAIVLTIFIVGIEYYIFKGILYMYVHM